MHKQDGFWQKPSNTVLMVISVLALGFSLVALFRRDAIETASAQQAAATTGKQRVALGVLQDGFVGIADAVEPSVVSIEATTRPDANATPDSGDNGDNSAPFQLPDPFGFFRNSPNQPSPQPQPRMGISTGSGVIVRVDGNTCYVLTNLHVVDGASKIQVILAGKDGEKVDGKVVGSDDKTDLALISMATPAGVTRANIPKLADSNKVKVGQWAIAIGNPLGVGETLTVGVISATGRELSGVEGFKDYRDMIQTDASINPGNSGGPLVDINGDVIGINTAIASPNRGGVGIGFAIPINVAKSILDQLISKGSVTRGYLGVAVSQMNRKLSPELKKYYGVEYGALVEQVNDNTPAAKAGVKPEDVITSWNGQKIADFDDLEAAVTSTPPGRQVDLVVVRGGKQVTLKVTTEKRKSEEELAKDINGAPSPGAADQPGKETKLATLGMSVSSLSPQDAQRLGLDAAIKGVLVTKWDLSGPAYEAGIPPGSVILRVGRTPTPTVSALMAAIKNVKPGEAIIMQVNAPSASGGRSTGIRTIKPEAK
ncbi:MAG TPA: trypsin-like peptidase domain-containing protein [Armatimonadota bacterium]|jgi:serine protease Do